MQQKIQIAMTYTQDGKFFSCNKKPRGRKILVSIWKLKDVIAKISVIIMSF